MQHQETEIVEVTGVEMKVEMKMEVEDWFQKSWEA
jgi:hypothetical protein